MIFFCATLIYGGYAEHYFVIHYGHLGGGNTNEKEILFQKNPKPLKRRFREATNDDINTLKL
jgi:hypothetical protein